MTKLKEITDLLVNYEHLFQNINDHETKAYPCMDVSLDLINELDFYGVDFTGEQQVHSLFFTGSSDYFPAIWLGESNINEIDQMPVYILDLSSSQDGTFESCGNIKQYVTQILDEILLCKKSSKKDKNDAKKLKILLEKFSDNVIDKGDYQLKINDDQ